MKIALTLAISFLFAATAHSQYQSIDSLRELIDLHINNEKTSHSKKIASARLIESTLRKHKEKYVEKDYFRLARDIAHFYHIAKEFDLSIDSYKQIAETTTDPLVRAEALGMVGWMYYGNKMDLDNAIKFFERGVELLNEYPDKSNVQRNELAGRTIATLGDIYRFKNRREDAIEMYDSVLENEQYVKFADVTTLVSVSSNLARLYAANGDVENAASYYSKLESYVNSPAGKKLHHGTRSGFLIETLSFAVNNGKGIDKLPQLESVVEGGWRSLPRLQ